MRTLTFMWALSLVLFLFILQECVLSEELYCYAPYGAPVKTEFLATSAVIEIIWVDQDRGEEVETLWSYDPETGISTCTVWIKMPEQIIGDPDMDGVGHESLHCFIGDFHE